MKAKKRKKSTRFRGTHTHGRGGKKKARGSGHRGGFGMAGTGKKADQKKTLVLNQKEDYFGKSKTLRRGRKIKLGTMTLGSLENSIDKLVKQNKASLKGDTYDINLDKLKIVGDEIGIKVKIRARSASEGAINAVKKSGGEIILPDEKE